MQGFGSSFMEPARIIQARAVYARAFLLQIREVQAREKFKPERSSTDFNNFDVEQTDGFRTLPCPLDLPSPNRSHERAVLR
jgi:hypothetical protein